MPNRNTFNPREKYDHSNHSTGHAQPGDLQPVGERDADGASEAGDRRPLRQPRERNGKKPRR